MLFVYFLLEIHASRGVFDRNNPASGHVVDILTFVEA